MSHRSSRVLVVDDDPELRALLQRFLSEHGYAVRAVDGGKAMDAALQREPADVIVLDLMMPGEDGLAVVRRLRAAGDATPVIMLTARGDPIDRVAEGFHARVVQHECDHLVGKLYPMRVRDFTRFGYTEVLFPGLDAADDD